MQADSKRAAIYCRVASKDDFAIEKQRYSLHRLAESKGYNDRAEYLDNGVNGLTLDRPAFKKLNADIADGTIQTVFIKCFSRIGRNTHQVIKWLNMARELGVEVISECDDIGDGLFEVMQYLTS